MIEIKEYDSPLTMQADLADWLEERAAINNLLLGLLYRMVRRAEAGAEVNAFMLAVFVDKKPVLAFLHLEPRFEMVMASADEGWELALDAAIGHFKTHPLVSNGVVGPEPQNSIFAAAVSSGFRPLFRQSIMRLDRLTWPRPAAGEMRLAAPKDAAILTKWMRAFFKESLSKDLPFDDAKQMIHAKLLERNFFVWDHDGLQSMAGVERPTREGITVVLVYTPETARGHGYASNLVAQITDQQLVKGRKFLCLHTDSDFPTSNKIYRELGYCVVGEGSILHFNEA